MLYQGLNFLTLNSSEGLDIIVTLDARERLDLIISLDASKGFNLVIALDAGERFDFVITFDPCEGLNVVLSLNTSKRLDFLTPNASEWLYFILSNGKSYRSCDQKSGHKGSERSLHDEESRLGSSVK